ncbi:transmembrane protein, putative [Medicago truncatula]|uniref:Transmembrane protein, putative n=1 Tax=Medicago truncatula TaxID=3880 RepID=G7JH94_MEDTR|nr:transmembrane protein, putative [Medicago truncatula]
MNIRTINLLLWRYIATTKFLGGNFLLQKYHMLISLSTSFPNLSRCFNPKRTYVLIIVGFLGSISLLSFSQSFVNNQQRERTKGLEIPPPPWSICMLSSGYDRVGFPAHYLLYPCMFISLLSSSFSDD